tara:strand:- start:4493 stop:11038 length:6546 start_codon:yes stop_codon:yes gene_type:complete
MALDLNVSPYYNDFDASKQFEKILFKPGVAVQARELTQLQSYLSNSINNHAQFNLSDGQRVTGGESSILRKPYIKINDVDASGTTVIDADLSTYVGDTVTGSVTGITAKILTTQTGTDSDNKNKKTLYLAYTGGNPTAAGSQGNAIHFDKGETLTVTSTVSARNNKTFVVDSTRSTTDESLNYYGYGLFFVVSDGVFFAKKQFVTHNRQEILLDKYKTNGSFYVGLKVSETVVNSDSDASLLDPSSGSFNYNAPGADRYKVSTTLAKKSLTEDSDEDFVATDKIVDGGYYQKLPDDADALAKLGKILAERTYEESGNYMVQPFTVDIQEHLDTGLNNGKFSSTDPDRPGDSQKLAVSVGNGTAYVNGFRHNFRTPTIVDVDKATTTAIQEGQTVSTGYGNYFIVDEFCGAWNIKDGDSVTLYDTAKTAVTGGTYGSTAAPSSSNIIGQAKIKNLYYDSGTIDTASCKYRIYLYDIAITKGKLEDARGVYYSNSTDSGFADIVLQGSPAVAKIQETTQNKLVFRAPYVNAKTLAAAGGGSYDTQYYYQEEFDVTFGTDGTMAVSTTGTSQFPYSGSITQTIINQNFILVATQSATINGTPTAEGRIIPLTPSMIISANTGTLNFDLGTVSGAFTAKLFVKVVNVDSTPVPKNLVSNVYVKIDTATNVGGANGPWDLGISDVFSIDEVYVGSSYSETTPNAKNNFTLDKGQTDNVYGHGKLVKSDITPIGTTNRKIVVKLKCFTPNYAATGGTYFAIDSYPVDDTGNTGIFTFQIPSYESKITGIYNLKDCIDFRPYIVNTAITATATLANATENPLRSNTINAPADGLQHPSPVNNFSTDVEFYLSRIDVLAITNTGNFEPVKGVPSLSPRVPVVPPSTGMAFAELNIPAYPSVSPFVAGITGNKNVVGKRLLPSRRFSMGDIGRIEKRINRLEYYTALSLLEQEQQNMNIEDANGNTRFKNGIFINVFTNHAFSDVGDPGFKCAIDPLKKKVGPAYEDTHIPLKINNTTSTGIKQSAELVTLPFTHDTVFSENRFASKARNCVGELLFEWGGDLDVSPRGSNNETNAPRNPRYVEDTSLNTFGYQLARDIQNAQIIADYDVSFATSPNQPKSQEWGASHESENKHQHTHTNTLSAGDSSSGSDGFGTPNRGVQVAVDTDINVDVTATTVTDTSTTTSASVKGEMITTSETITATASKEILTASAQPYTTDYTALGENLVSASLDLYMRDKLLYYVGQRLKPNTRLYGFFDGQKLAGRFLWSLIPGNITIGGVTKTAVEWVTEYKNDPSTPNNVWDWENYAWNIGAEQIASTWAGSGQHGEVIVNDSGQIGGFFYLEGGRYHVGERILRFTDDVRDRPEFVTTSCEAPFSSTGISTESQETIIATAVPKISLGKVSGGTSEFSWTNITGVEIANVELAVDTQTTVKTQTDLNVDIETETHVQVTGGFDPIAQTFFVEEPDGVFAKDVKVFFRTKSESLGITCQLRQVINGYPARSILPYGEVYLPPEQVDTTVEELDGTLRFSPVGQEDQPYVTTFEFPAPVQLKGGTEYCFVLLPAGNSPDYQVWVSELGQDRVGVGVQNQRIFAEDTNIGGMLFTSSNNRTWNAHQAEDMMYQITKCQFASSDGTLMLENEDEDYLVTQDYSAGRPVSGASVHGIDATLSNGGSGHQAGDIITMADVVDSSGLVLTGVKIKVLAPATPGTITSFEISDPGNPAVGFKKDILGVCNQISTTGSGTGASIEGDFAQGMITDVDSVNEKIELKVTQGFFRNQTTGAIVTPVTATQRTTATVSYTSFTITEIEDRKYNQVRTTMNLVENDGKIGFEYAPTKSANVNTAGTAYERLSLNVRKDTDDEKSVRSYSNESYYLSGADTKSLHKRITLNGGSNPNLSPVLESTALGLLAMRNLVNNDNTGETLPASGNALSRYINKPVRLADGMEAQDILVQAALFQPPGSLIEVYGKFQADADDADFNDDLPWIKLDRDDNWSPYGASQSETTFVDFGFKIPDANKTGGIYTYSTDRVTEITLTAAGSGYTSAPELLFSTGEATAIAILSGTTIGSLTLTNPGRDYAGVTPTVTVGTQYANSTIYATGQQVAAGANLYTVQSGGTSASTGSGPTHTDSSTPTDGTATFAYAGAAATVTATVSTVTFDEFKKFATKLVFLSSNTSKVPFAKQLRCIAVT